MNQYDFDQLLKKYLAGQCSPEEEEQVLKWSAHVLNDEREPLNTVEQKETRKRLWKQLNASALAKKYRIGWRQLALAAVVVLVSGLGYFFYRSATIPSSTPTVVRSSSEPATKPFEPSGYVVTKNTSSSPLDVTLEDGTVISLKRNSILSYPRHFDAKTRKVMLEGGAFFSVKRDATRPFLVYTGELVTQVLGTSFTIESYRNAKTIEVQVVSGRVSVYENQRQSHQNRNGMILNPNQKITFDKTAKKLVAGLVAAPLIIEQPREKSELVFEEMPLPRVLEALQKAYQIEIIVETPALETCVFTGNLNDLPLHTQLLFICKSVNASYELRGTTFFVRGDGCLTN
ncbi:FecR family protein [Larkinella arboricola]